MFVWIAFGAGLVRGYSGFGFAMLLALGLLTRLPPGQVVPVALMLDLVCSITLWPAALRGFHVAIGSRLIIGMLIAVPLGAWLLRMVPAQWMAPIIALLCLAGGLMVLYRPSVAPADGPRTKGALTAGLASGLAMTMASAGGPPLILYLLRSGLSAAHLRGTAILFFVASSGCALLGLWLFGVVGYQHVALAASLVLPALAGNLAGQLLHRYWQPLPMRIVMGVILVLTSTAMLWRSLARALAAA
ncbi:sulfite exporter TauE/SafE family protein [Stutzerimonas stutzeri]|uniref:Probable membrane transporter protein n=1 Tax=Stutzerimonas stutzeri TaxID=316 RepID=A0A6I6LI82_STUST|nr:sulfite exporter TauE/SafE family protein [Stutzerimonas stutzeri]QGZ28577.1 TSUP family transporter [Stutzerimonas stutzeri]